MTKTQGLRFFLNSVSYRCPFGPLAEGFQYQGEATCLTREEIGEEFGWGIYIHTFTEADRGFWKAGGAGRAWARILKGGGAWRSEL